MALVMIPAVATILMAARTTYAFGRAAPMFSWLGRWHPRRDAPVNALLAHLTGEALALYAAARRHLPETVTAGARLCAHTPPGADRVYCRVRDRGAASPGCRSPRER